MYLSQTSGCGASQRIGIRVLLALLFTFVVVANGARAQSPSNLPLPKFYFQVDGLGGGGSMYFQEVSGLTEQTQALEYRPGNSKEQVTVKMPDIKKFGNVTLKKGVSTKGNKLMTLFNKIKMNTLKRHTVVIKLLDETGSAVMSWTLINAFATKMTVTDWKSEGNVIAIETLELAHEGLTVSNP